MAHGGKSRVPFLQRLAERANAKYKTMKTITIDETGEMLRIATELKEKIADLHETNVRAAIKGEDDIEQPNEEKFADVSPEGDY